MRNNTKYLLAAQHFGAANATIPVAKELKSRGNDVVYLAHDQAEIKCVELGFPYKTTADYGVPNELPAFNADSMKDVLRAISPDYVLTGSCSEREWNGLEKSLIMASQQMGIPTTMLVDLWPEADIRFKNYLNPDSLIVPEKVCVLDAEGKRLVTQQGIPADKVFVTGNPYFDMSLKEYLGLDDVWKRNVKGRAGMSTNRPLMFYAGNAFRKEEGDFCDFDNVYAINETLTDSSLDLSIVVRLHGRMPDEEVKEIRNYLVRAGNSKLTLLPGDVPSNRHLAFAADIVATPNSTDGVTAIIAGKPVLSMMGTDKNGVFFPNEIGAAHRVGDYSLLPEILRRLLNDPSYKYTLCPNLSSFSPDGKATERIIEVMKC